MDPIFSYGTHLVPLIVSLNLTKGPVLELGMGPVSSPLLHTLCKNAFPPRSVVSLEEDEFWLKEFRSLAEGLHQMRHVANWDKVIDLIGTEWDVVLVDNEKIKDARANIAKGEFFVIRRKIVERFKKSKIIVIHDSDSFHLSQEWIDLIKSFKYYWNYTFQNPSTLVLSNEIDVKDMFLKGLVKQNELNSLC